MSLINDALKRANSDKNREAQQSANPPPAVPPLQPVETPKSSSVLPWAIMLLGIGVLAIAAALWFRSGSTPTREVVRSADAPSTITSGSESSATTAQPVPALETETSTASPASAEVATTSTEISAQQPAQSSTSAPHQVVSGQTTPPTAAESATTQSTPAPAQGSAVDAVQTTNLANATTTSTPPPTVAATPAPSTTPATPAQPRLQAIYYRFRNPTVVINGKTLRVGESVDGIKVVSIQRTSVEILQDGQYRTLTMD